MINTHQLKISDESWLEATNIVKGVFNPVTGPMNQKNYDSVISNMRLTCGQPWSLPITLEIPEFEIDHIKKCEILNLINTDNIEVGKLFINDIFFVNYQNDINKIFLTNTLEHPGVKKEVSRSPYRVGGEITLSYLYPVEYPSLNLYPDEVRKIFMDKGWKKIVGFQTRNPPHRAHEYLQRIGMEIADGIFIHPLIGWKKTGDFTPKAIIEAYQLMINQFYPLERAYLGALNVSMRYAGPREAVFHALIRKNFGCTHFIVGRDHAGVGGFYGKYDAQKLCYELGDLGIEILSLSGPYYCRRCLGIVTEKTCKHFGEDIMDISGSNIRKTFEQIKTPSVDIMRAEISTKLIDLKKKSQLFN
jgi:sulfate adenylyltransferase